MNDKLTPAQIKKLKARFRAAKCVVKDLNDSAFEIVFDYSEFPLRSHVEVNPFYIQIGTSVLAKPKRTVRKAKVQDLLCKINLKAKVIKFTMDTDKPDASTKAWPMLATFKLVTGVAGGNYQASAIRNLLLLWIQDIAELMSDGPSAFEYHPMFDLEKLANAQEEQFSE